MANGILTGEEEFESAFTEAVLNDALIDWQYWVQKMPVLTSSQAARLISGLDPQKFEQLGTSTTCLTVERFQWLAGAMGMAYASPREWLQWADSQGLPVHGNFRTEAMNLPLTTSTPVASPSKEAVQGPGWMLKSPVRFPGYRKPLYDLLKAAYAAGEPCPKARDVLDKWKINPPLDLEIMSDGLKYDDAQGKHKEADLKAIQQAIKGLTELI
ncbi:hypothetical protein [Comamonas sp. C24C]